MRVFMVFLVCCVCVRFLCKMSIARSKENVLDVCESQYYRRSVTKAEHQLNEHCFRINFQSNVKVNLKLKHHQLQHTVYQQQQVAETKTENEMRLCVEVVRVCLCMGCVQIC